MGLRNHFQRRIGLRDTGLSSKQTPVEIDQDLGEQGSVVDGDMQDRMYNDHLQDMVDPLLSGPRKSQRQRRPKRHFDEID